MGECSGGVEGLGYPSGPRGRAIREQRKLCLTPMSFTPQLRLLGSGGNSMKLPYILVVAVAGLIGSAAAAAPTLAHPGGLNSEGCHNNRKTGDYHCHREGSAPKAQKDDDAGSGGGAFRNCSAARAAGAAPVRRGDAGYGSHLDRDNDGVGCE